MRSEGPGICVRLGLRIERAKLRDGGARLRIKVTRRARLALVVYRERPIDCATGVPTAAGSPLRCSSLQAVKGLPIIRLRRGASTVRVRGRGGLAPGRYRLQLAAGTGGARADFPLLSFRR